jgi:hypothetical protein
MSQEQRQIDDRFLRQMLFKHATLPVIGSAILWLFYAVNALYHVDILHLLARHEREGASPTESLIVAAVVSCLALVYAIVRTYKAITLARFGEEVEGTICKHGLFSYGGRLRVECSYRIGNEEHRLIWSTDRDFAPSVGEKVVLLVDPRKPKRCMLIEDVYPDRKREVKSVAKTLQRRIFEYSMCCVAAVGITWAIWNAFHKAGPLVPAVASDPTPADPPAAIAEQAAKPATRPPGKEILFQPMFVWENSVPTHQGTGFFVNAPGGKVAAVTNMPFLDVDGPRLHEARWLSLADDKPVAVFKRSWGPPGTAAAIRMTAGKDPDGKPKVVTLPRPDKRTDYLIMPAPAGTPAGVALELDPRTMIDPGERVYFHDKCSFGQKDYAVLEGQVIKSSPEQYQVMLDQDIKPDSQSGSPVISQTTGKVIGIVAGIGDPGDNPVGALFGGGGGPPRLLVLTPSCAILKALEDGREFPILADVIGKKAAGVSESPQDKR